MDTPNVYFAEAKRRNETRITDNGFSLNQVSIKLQKYEQQKKKRDYMEREEEILHKLIDNYEYLWEIKCSGQAKFEN